MFRPHNLLVKGTMKTTNRLLALALCLSVFLFVLSRKSDDVVDEYVNYKSPFCECKRRILTRASFDESTVHWCSEESTLRGPGQNVVSYSLYGNSVADNKTTRYYLIIDSLPKQVKHFYPDWRMRIYHNIRKNQTREHDILCDVYCKNDNVDLCEVNWMIESFALVKNRTSSSIPILSDQLAKFNKMNWRYLPMLDPLVDRIIARDTDSEVNSREVAAVQQWLESPHTFHVMRDHQGHLYYILGGMFGVKVFQERRLVQGLMRSMVTQGTNHGYGFDQELLASLFWPTVKDDAMIHDSYHCEKDWNSLPVMPYPTQRDPVTKAFATDRSGSEWQRPSECPVACRPPNHPDWTHC